MSKLHQTLLRKFELDQTLEELRQGFFTSHPEFEEELRVGVNRIIDAFWNGWHMPYYSTHDVEVFEVHPGEGEVWASIGLHYDSSDVQCTYELIVAVTEEGEVLTEAEFNDDTLHKFPN